jgi:hypothetical protein
MQNIRSIDPSTVRCDVVVGTHPEAIKLAPVIKVLRKSEDDFLVRVVSSGQHGEICHSALAAFGLTADSELDIEPISGSLADTAGNLLRAFGRRFADTLGGIGSQPYFSYPARLPADIIADAQRNLVVRDGWASFFYHSYDSISYLQQTVIGLKNMGYTFVSPTAA